MGVAFGLGVLSALSLLLGAITARIWRPPSMLIGVLMAFGGGALLAALTIELAAPAVHRGHVWPLVGGCVVGGLLFVFLERLVNERGGFLRKTATTISHVRRQEQRRLRELLRSLGRLDVFEGQPEHVLEELATALVGISYEPGATIYRHGDPCHNLYIVAEGEVDLVPPEPEAEKVHIRQGSAFGHLAFMGGMRHTVTAVARTPVRLWRMPKKEFLQAVRNSVALSRSYERYLGSMAATTYLERVWGMDGKARETWNADLIRAVHEQTEMPAVLDEPERGAGDVKTLLRHFNDLSALPDHELELLAEHVFVKAHDPGHAFFRRGESADRIYFLDEGTVSLVDASPQTRHAEELKPGRIFGTLSFFTGSHHTATAVANTRVRVGVLRRRDLQGVLGSCPHLKEAIEGWIQAKSMDHYLRHRQGLDPDKASTWVRSALRNLRAGRLLPSVESMMAEVHRPEGAPVAIWLGILLDGIPESLVIGASLVHSSPTGVLALVVGLFIANYPEALSSSVGMMEQGIRFPKVLMMWGAIVLLTGVGAALGYGMLSGAPGWVFALIQGIAAGAMLTMIAETMLPEAYARGGHLTGLATLLGFLTAILVSALSGGPSVH